MKHVISVAVLLLVTLAIVSGWTDMWLVFWITFVLSLVFGIVLISIYAIEDINRNKQAEQDRK